MPLYEYVCRQCAHPFEELVFGDASPSCPKCAAAEVQRVPVSKVSVGSADGSRPAIGAGGGCGACGDPRGPGACRAS